jgi:hypothetical protein
VKLERLKAIAQAALAGELEAERLRTLAIDDAHAELQRLPLLVSTWWGLWGCFSPDLEVGVPCGSRASVPRVRPA